MRELRVAEQITVVVPVHTMGAWGAAPGPASGAAGATGTSTRGRMSILEFLRGSVLVAVDVVAVADVVVPSRVERLSLAREVPFRRLVHQLAVTGAEVVGHDRRRFFDRARDTRARRLPVGGSRPRGLFSAPCG